MKKYIAFILALIMILSACACGDGGAATDAVTDTTDAAAELPTEEEPTKGGFDPNAVIDAIDETVPMGGVYQVHSLTGVQQLALHPDAKFKLLRDIDLGGAQIAPAGSASTPFTGQLDGSTHVISNFTVTPGEDGNTGLFGVLKGSAKDLILDKVTIQTNEKTQNAGAIAGVNEGTISRVTLTGGSMSVEGAADGVSCGAVAGRNTGSISNTTVEVDITCSSAGSANVGGIAGSCEGGSMNYAEQDGAIVVEGGSSKKVGLIAGSAKDTDIKACAFVGAANTIDGVLFTDLVGESDGATVEKCLTRDNGREPLPAAQQALRDRVVDKMYEMGSVVWTVKEKLYHDCTCTLTACHGIFYPGMTYVGMPYGHKNASIGRFMSMMDENNCVVDWAYDKDSFDTYDSYMNNDCSGAVFQAWVTVSNTVNICRVSGELPSSNMGCYPVGDYPWELITSYKDRDTSAEWITDGTIPEEVMLESYAQMRKGDAYWYRITAGGHTRMAAEDPVVVRDQDGKIDPNLSYIICHEQGATHQEDDVYSSWKTNWRYNFAALLSIGAYPVTIEELMTGEMETPEASMIGGADGKAGLFTGTVKANYYLDAVTMKIDDEDGNEVFNSTMYPALGRVHDGSDGGGGADTTIRCYVDSYDMAGFATPLQKLMMKPGATYHATVTAYLATGDEIVVKDYTFTNGAAVAKGN